jgi:hypothetical protein
LLDKTELRKLALSISLGADHPVERITVITITEGLEPPFGRLHHSGASTVRFFFFFHRPFAVKEAGSE